MTPSTLRSAANHLEVAAQKGRSITPRFMVEVAKLLRAIAYDSEKGWVQPKNTVRQADKVADCTIGGISE